MLGGITFTLYEIFGYLLPGSVALAGLVVFYWTLFLHRIALPIKKSQPDTAQTVMLVLACYLLGHVMQAIANLWCKRLEEQLLGDGESVPQEFVESARQRVSTVVGVPPTKICAAWLFKAMDDFRVQAGIAGDREMFIYREGFYKGSSTALSFLSLAFAVRTIVPEATLKFSEYTYILSRWETGSVAVFAGTVAWLLARRSRRFAEYRVAHALIGFLISTGRGGNVSATTAGSAK